MKKVLFACTMVVSLVAGEFEFIKPVAVEYAPKKEEVKKPQKKVEQKPVAQQNVEIDSDGDGVVDSKDKCPNTKDGFAVDYSGCPITKILKVTFEPYKTDISGSLDEIKKFAEFLNEHTKYQIVVYGYTDSSGDAEQNKKLSQKRAEAVVKALNSFGVKSTRMTAVGMGEENPIADNSTPEGRAKNRRIEVEIIE